MAQLMTLLMLMVAGASSTVGEYISAPLRLVGSSVPGVINLLGAPAESSYEIVQNLHEPNMSNVRVTLKYPHIEVGVLVVLCCNKQLVESVLVSEPAAAEALGISWPRSAEEVEAMLGGAQASTDDSLTYSLESEVGSDSVVFKTHQGAVVAIAWKYPSE